MSAVAADGHECNILHTVHQVSDRIISLCTSCRTTTTRLSLQDHSVEKAKLADTDTVVLYVHGYGGSYDDIGALAIRKGYVNGTDDHNLILVDYSKLNGKIIGSNVVTLAIRYAKAVYCDLPKVSQKIVDFIKKILNKRPEIKRVHIIGISLGGQIAGKVGTLYKKATGRHLYRVTALDPAGPSFKNDPQIHPDSAEVVDVIHSNIGYYGYIKPMGTADFYMNNGVTQPSCIANQTEVKRLLDKPYVNENFCSHGSSVLYFAASIDNKLLAKPCKQIGEIVSDDQVNLLEVDEDNDNAISKTCNAHGTTTDDGRVVFGHHMSSSTTGLFYAHVPDLYRYVGKLFNKFKPEL
ncbi:phospholipase A1-like isoform X2 [Adelges cooleyi]|uniref:phospholipase A1-like isoform X2 n=1 Tax=Adelges cooleyi TaxID=133065 RepID=UPI0021807E39|nr:phospholipase A1-like isoform X2 [Adelges cooleyi]